MQRLRTAIIGFGKVAAGWSYDSLVARYYPFATHAQVLSSHPGFAWEAVVDVSEKALADAQVEWKIPFTFRSVEEMCSEYHPEVIVVATPPEGRLALLEKVRGIKAVLLEKPVEYNLENSVKIIDLCKSTG